MAPEQILTAAPGAVRKAPNGREFLQKMVAGPPTALEGGSGQRSGRSPAALSGSALGMALVIRPT